MDVVGPDGRVFRDVPVSDARAGDSEGSPRPWRITDSDPCIIHDCRGGLVAALWSRVRGEGRGRADAALIVAAVNAYRPPRSDCVLPLGHSGPCVSETSVRPGPFSGAELKHLHRTDCVLPVTHSGPCIAAGPACALSDDCGGRVGHAGLCQPMPCPRDPVCDQRAGHEGSCRYEFPAGPPAAPASDARKESKAFWDGLDYQQAGQRARESMAQREGEARATLSADCARPLEHAPGCECSRLA